MRHVTGYGWEGGAPVLRWRREGSTRVDTLPLLGELRLGIGERRCVGYSEGRARRPCPDGASPTGKQCPGCMARDTFRPCLICDGFACPRLVPSVRESCRGIHHLYLASFGGPEIKVGTASDARRRARLVEQGPVVAFRIARGAGPRIKQLEHIASTRTDAVEGMRRSRKLALLRNRGDDPGVEARLLEVLADVRAVAGPDYDALFQVPERVSMPRLAEQTRASIGGEPEMPIERGRLLEGEIVGAVGHVALLSEPAGRFLVDLGELVGRLVDPEPSGEVRRPTVQLGLFGG